MTDYKLVPMEPTAEMLEAGKKEVDWYEHNAIDCYQAMLAAAPAVQGEPVAYLRKDQLTHVKRMGPMLGEIADNPRADRVPVYAAPQPAPEPLKSSLALDAATHLTNWLDMNLCECDGGHTCGYNEVRRTRDALLVAAEQPPPDVSALVEALEEMICVAERVDSWESFPSAPIERAIDALAAHRKQPEGEA